MPLKAKHLKIAKITMTHGAFGFPEKLKAQLMVWGRLVFHVTLLGMSNEG